MHWLRPERDPSGKAKIAARSHIQELLEAANGRVTEFKFSNPDVSKPLWGIKGVPKDNHSKLNPGNVAETMTRSKIMRMIMCNINGKPGISDSLNGPYRDSPSC